MSGLVDENTAPRLGNILGVQALISGSVNEWQTTCQNIQVVAGAAPAILCVSAARITLKLIDVETGQIIWSASARGSTLGINLQAIAAEKAIEKIVQQLRPRLQFQVKNTDKYISGERVKDKHSLQPTNAANKDKCYDDCMKIYRKGELKKDLTIEDCIRILCK